MITACLTAMKISPFYTLQSACGITTISINTKDLSTLESRVNMSAGVIYIASSFPMIYANFQQYKHAKELLKKHGYDRRLFNNHLKTFCGRSLLKQAAIETGYLQLFREHLKSANVKWYHVDPNPILRILHIGVPSMVLTSTIIALSNLTKKS